MVDGVRLPTPRKCPACRTYGSISGGLCHFCGEHTHPAGRTCRVAGCNHYEPTKAEIRAQEQEAHDDDERYLSGYDLLAALL